MRTSASRSRRHRTSSVIGQAVFALICPRIRGARAPLGIVIVEDLAQGRDGYGPQFSERLRGVLDDLAARPPPGQPDELGDRGAGVRPDGPSARAASARDAGVGAGRAAMRSGIAARASGPIRASTNAAISRIGASATPPSTLAASAATASRNRSTAWSARDRGLRIGSDQAQSFGREPADAQVLVPEGLDELRHRVGRLAAEPPERLDRGNAQRIAPLLVLAQDIDLPLILEGSDGDLAGRDRADLGVHHPGERRDDRLRLGRGARPGSQRRSSGCGHTERNRGEKGPGGLALELPAFLAGSHNRGLRLANFGHGLPVAGGPLGQGSTGHSRSRAARECPDRRGP